jgi:hypothetical protein
MADNHLTRDTREVSNRDTAKHKQAWTPPETLPSPTPVPGMVFRWIRTSMMGQSDPTNASAKFREGWVAVKASEVPELMIIADQNPNSRFKDNIEVGGLLLCKAPIEMVKQRAEYYTQQANNQMEAVDSNYMRQKDDRANMALFAERKADVTFGRGNKS